MAAEPPTLGALTNIDVDQMLSIHPTIGSAIWCHTAMPARNEGRRDLTYQEFTPAGTRDHRPESSRHWISRPESLLIESTTRDELIIIVPSGVLDLASYAQLRTTLLKHALELPRAMVINIDGLHVVTDTFIAVLNSVWKEISEWPGVPILLVTADNSTAATLRRNGITRFIPVHRTIDQAAISLGEPPPHRRAVFSIPRDRASGTVTRQHVKQICGRWACESNAVYDATLIATELAESATRHTSKTTRMRLELDEGKLTIAVHDDLTRPPISAHTTTKSQLGRALVENLAYTWGHAHTPSGGKVTWAILLVAHRGQG